MTISMLKRAMIRLFFWFAKHYRILFQHYFILASSDKQNDLAA